MPETLDHIRHFSLVMKPQLNSTSFTAGNPPGMITVLMALALCGSLVSVQTRAIDFKLSSNGLSPKGNLGFDLAGPSKSSAVVETSPNLVDWTSAGLVTLTNGQSGFFLPPTSDELFCRVREATTNDFPRTPSFIPAVNSDFVKTTFVTDDGLEIKFTDDGGFTYDVTFGSDSLFEPLDVVMEVVNDTTELPSGWTYLGGIQLSPFPTPVFGDAQLVITTPAGTDISKVVAVTWDAGGKNLHLVPHTIAEAKITIQLNHLGGFGLCSVTGKIGGPVLEARPYRKMDTTEQLLALAQLGLLNNEGTGLKAQSELSAQAGSLPPLTPCDFGSAFERLISREVLQPLHAALYSDSTLEESLHNYAGITADVTDFVGEPCNEPLRRLIAQTDALALQALNNSIDRAVQQCKQHNLKALVRLWRDIRLTRKGHWGQSVSLAERERYRQLLHDCAQFKLEVLSSISYTTAAGTVISSASSTLLLQAETTSPGKLSIIGNGPSTLDTTEWQNPPAGCSISSAPASGSMAVQNLAIYNFDTDVENHILRSDDDIRLPTYKLLWDPLVVPASEHYTITCVGVSAPQLGSFWGAIFGGFHKDEIKKTSGGRQVMLVDQWNLQSVILPEKKEYQRSGSIAGGSANETTTLFLYFTGGSQ